MSETPSKTRQFLSLEVNDGYAYGGANASIIDEMPMAHITDTRVRACLMKSTLKTMMCPDFTHIDYVYD